MSDPGTKAADAAQAALERRMRKVYRQAQEEIVEKLNEHLKKFMAMDERKRAQLESGKITPEQYRHWLNGQVFIGKQWQDKVTSVAATLMNANQQANAMIEGKKRVVFGENATFQAYKLEHDAGMDLSFSVYDSATVTRLLKEHPELLPRKVVNGVKDQAWNRRKIANAVTQGIIQGESIDDIAKRIARQTGSQNMSAMTRYARTALTGAQNAGRMETMHEAQDMGIKVKKKWIATLDKRTRDAHQDLDGQVQEVDKPFESELGKIMYPGDITAHPGNFWNCRCTLTYVYDEYPEQYSQRRAYVEYVDDDGKYHRESHEIANMSYRVWKLAKDRDNQRALEVWRSGKGAVVSSPVGLKTGTGAPFHSLYNGTVESIKNAINAHSENWTLDDYQKVGTMVSDEVEKAVSDNSPEIATRLQQIAELKEQREKLADEIDGLRAEWMSAYKSGKGIGSEIAYLDKITKLNEEADNLYARKLFLEKELKALQSKETQLFGILKKIRPMGGVTIDNLHEYIDEALLKAQKGKTRTNILEALNLYPSSWLEKSKAHAITLKPKWTEGRAHYSPGIGEILVSARKGSNAHELGHRMEHIISGILQSEGEFYSKRTSGDVLESLRALTGNTKYDPTEMTRKDQFINPYMGKDYNGSAYELVSMGFEYALTDYETLAKDRDMLTWILGLLSSAE